MKGYWFFLEWPGRKARREDSRTAPTKHSGNVIARATTIRPRYVGTKLMHEGYVATYPDPNSPVNRSGSICGDHLRRLCRRISEKRARVIHPELFKRLDGDQKL